MEKYRSGLRTYRRFYRDNKIELKVAAIVITITIATLFFYLKGDFLNIDKKQNEAGNSKPSYQKQNDIVKEKKTSEIELLTVDISGKVKTPGVYQIKKGGRINDVIALAGGLIEDADINRLNRAEKVKDGQKIYIPYVGEKGDPNNSVISNTSGSISGGSQAVININDASKEELQKIPGVGPSKADSIIEYRNTNGRFRRKEDIKNISGIGEKTYKKLEGFITV